MAELPQRPILVGTAFQTYVFQRFFALKYQFVVGIPVGFLQNICEIRPLSTSLLTKKCAFFNPINERKNDHETIDTRNQKETAPAVRARE